MADIIKQSLLTSALDFGIFDETEISFFSPDNRYEHTFHIPFINDQEFLEWREREQAKPTAPRWVMIVENREEVGHYALQASSIKRKLKERGKGEWEKFVDAYRKAQADAQKSA